MYYKFLSILTFSLLCNFLFSETFNKSDAIEYFLNAEYELLNENFNVAESYYKKALKFEPNSIVILKSLYEIKFRKGEYLNAIYFLEEINKIDHYNPEYCIELYKLYSDLEKKSQAKSLLDSLQLYNPNNLDILLLVAEVSYINHDWKKLIKTYFTIFKNDDNNYDILNRMVDIGISFGENKLVYQILQKLKIDYKNIEILRLLVKTAISLNLYESAINANLEIISLDKKSINNKLQLVELYLQIGKYEEAANILHPLYINNSDNLYILRFLLISYSALNNTEKELEISKVIIQFHPEITLGYEALSYIYINNQNYSDAITLLLQACNKFPNNTSFPLLLAKVYYQLKNYNKAMGYYLNILDKDHNNYLVKHSLAILYEEINDFSNSDSLFKNILEFNKEFSVAFNDYAYIIAERKNSTNEELNYALDLAKQAIKLEPENSAFLDTIGWIYFKLGNEELAKKYLEISLTYDNNNPIIFEHLGDIYLYLKEVSTAKNLYMKALDLNINNLSVKKKLKEIDG